MRWFALESAGTLSGEGGVDHECCFLWGRCGARGQGGALVLFLMGEKRVATGSACPVSIEGGVRLVVRKNAGAVFCRVGAGHAAGGSAGTLQSGLGRADGWEKCKFSLLW